MVHTPRLSSASPAAGRIVAALVVVGLGALAAFLSGYVTGLPAKNQLALIVGVTGIAAMLIVVRTRLYRYGIIGLFVFSVAANVSFSFFFHERSVGNFVDNVGGAGGVTITLTLIVSLLMLLTLFGDALAGRRTGVWRPNWPLIWAQIAFMIAGLVSMVHAYDETLVWLELLRLALLLVVFLIVSSLGAEDFSRLLLLLPAGVIFEALIAVGEYAKGSTLGLAFIGEVDLFQENIDFDTRLRSVGLKVNPNFLSYFFEILYPLCLALALSKAPRLTRLMGLAGAGAAVLGILTTLSRAGWGTIPLSTLVLVFAVYRDRLRSRTTVIAGVIGLAVLLVAGFVVGPMIWERFTADDGGSASHRAPLNAAALSMIKQFPFVGVGLNNFGVSLPIYDTTGNSRLFANVNHVVHNMHLLVIGEVGIVGYLCFMAIFVVAAVLAWRTARRLPMGHPIAAVAIGAAMGLWAQLFHGLVDPGFRLNLGVEELVYIMLALIAAAVRFSKGPPQR